MFSNIVDATGQVLGAVERDAATDVDGSHRHTSGEQRARLKSEAADAQSDDVAADDGRPHVGREAHRTVDERGHSVAAHLDAMASGLQARHA